MAFTKVAHTEYGANGVTSITLDVPSGVADNDILFAILKHALGSSEQPNSAPSGWTLVAHEYEATSGSTYSLYWKIASSESGSYVWGYASAGRNGGVCVAYRDWFDTADPIDSYSSTSYTTADTTLRAASFSVAAANSAVIFLGAVHRGGSAYTFSPPTNPSTFTEDVDRWDTNSRAAITVASLVWSGSGSTGDIDATISGSEGGKHAFAISLNPAAAVEVEAKPAVYGVDFGHSLCPDHLYMMDEGTGSTLTDKGKTGGLNLAITGADWTTDPTHGNVLDFVGANTDYAQVAVSGLTGTHTLCALVYASAGSVQRTIASFCDSGDFDRYVALVYQADEDLEAVSRFDATAVTNTSTTDIPADTWSLVFMRFSDTTIDWSLNGSAWTTQAVSHSGLVAAINRFTVGYRNTSSPGNPWDDQMAALMWWRSSLSDANIASIAADPWQYLTPGGAHKLIGKFGGKLRGKI